MVRMGSLASIPALDRFQLRPPSTVLKTPCPADPEYRTSGLPGCMASDVTVFAVSPFDRFSHVVPPSLVKKTPALPVASQTMFESAGWTARPRTDNCWMALASKADQVVPPSLEIIKLYTVGSWQFSCLGIVEHFQVLKPPYT